MGFNRILNSIDGLHTQNKALCSDCARSGIGTCTLGDSAALVLLSRATYCLHSEIIMDKRERLFLFVKGQPR